MAKKRYTRVEEEILQILNEADHEPAWRRARSWLSRGGRRRRRPPTPRRTLRIEALVPFVLSFALALAAIFVAGSSHTVAGVLAIASILVFLSPFVSRRGQSAMTPSVHRWRGRDIELPPSRGGFIGEIRYRLWRLRNRP
ncbi:MAG TPA: hypothetical protein VFN57_03760 [Thermomicrobiaceae bacterium]|nr:hypothetical protein [Thermomicrobiaceae bacterium]